MGCYAQLTQEQRYQIHGLMKAGFNQSEMALKAGVHRSTVSREIRCNGGQRGYRPVQDRLNNANYFRAVILAKQ